MLLGSFLLTFKNLNPYTFYKKSLVPSIVKIASKTFFFKSPYVL